jgi:predicted RNase H-like HicB family nuclease
MYNFSINWSTEDHCYVATVEEMPGFITHGHTAALALEALEDLLAVLDQLAEDD